MNNTHRPGSFLHVSLLFTSARPLGARPRTKHTKHPAGVNLIFPPYFHSSSSSALSYYCWLSWSNAEQRGMQMRWTLHKDKKHSLHYRKARPLKVSASFLIGTRLRRRGRLALFLSCSRAGSGLVRPRLQHIWASSTSFTLSTSTLYLINKSHRLQWHQTPRLKKYKLTALYCLILTWSVFPPPRNIRGSLVSRFLFYSGRRPGTPASFQVRPPAGSAF